MWGCFCCILLREQIGGLMDKWTLRVCWYERPGIVKCLIGNESTRDRKHVVSGHFVNEDASFWILWSELLMIFEYKLGMSKGSWVYAAAILCEDWEGKIRSCDFVSEPQKFELCVGLSTTQGDCFVSHPPFLVTPQHQHHYPQL